MNYFRNETERDSSFGEAATLVQIVSLSKPCLTPYQSLPSKSLLFLPQTNFWEVSMEGSSSIGKRASGWPPGCLFCTRIKVGCGHRICNPCVKCTEQLAGHLDVCLQMSRKSAVLKQKLDLPPGKTVLLLHVPRAQVKVKEQSCHS